jgi:hypothetical protein
MKTQRKEKDVENLLNLMSSLPKANTEMTSNESQKKNDKWKHRSTNNISTKGRVNRTRGK